MSIRHILFLAFLFVDCEALCLDPPLGAFVDHLSVAVQIEASQIDFGAFEEESRICDSIQGPSCHLLPEYGSIRTSVRNMNGDILSRVLGLPTHVSVAVSTPSMNKPGSLESDISLFRGYQLRLDDHPSILSEKLNRIPVGIDGKLGPVRIQWVGSGWYYNPSTRVPYLVIDENSTPRAHSMRFSNPVVFQQLEINPMEPMRGAMFLLGKLKGKEVWRKDISNPLVGAQVFAKWPGNGSIFRAKVMFHEPGVETYHLSWSDGDQTYRMVDRESILSVVPGHVENLYSVDEVLFVSPSGGVFEISSLIVSVGLRSDPDKRVIRSGGGMVFEDTVSAGAVLYSAKEMVQNRFIIKRSKESEKSFNKYLDLYSSAVASPPSPASRRSYRNLVLYWIFNPSSPLLELISHVITSREDLVTSYLNINHLFSGIVDNDDKWFDESIKFSHWVQSGFPVSIIPGTVSVSDTFEGTFVCAGVVTLKIEVMSVTHTRPTDKHVDVAVSISSGTSKFFASAEFFPNVGMIYIPPGDGWKYPLTLFVTKLNTFTVDLVGTVEYVGCGAAILRGVAVTESTRSSIPSVVDDPSKMVDILKRFNAILKAAGTVSGPRRAFQLNL